MQGHIREEVHTFSLCCAAHSSCVKQGEKVGKVMTHPSPSLLAVRDAVGIRHTAGVRRDCQAGEHDLSRELPLPWDRHRCA